MALIADEYTLEVAKSFLPSKSINGIKSIETMSASVSQQQLTALLAVFLKNLDKAILMCSFRPQTVPASNHSRVATSLLTWKQNRISGRMVQMIRAQDP